jgi:nucleotide-binding universal stress UspA family protein
MSNTVRPAIARACATAADQLQEVAEQPAADLLPDSPAVVLTVWEPFLTMMMRSPAGLGPVVGVPDIQGIDDACRQSAQARAEEGAELAHDAGIDANARVVSRSGSVAEAILHEAADANATAIVLGSRGLTGVKSLLLGSVSHGVLQHADRAVLVVPSPAVAEERHHSNEQAHAGRV